MAVDSDGAARPREARDPLSSLLDDAEQWPITRAYRLMPDAMRRYLMGRLASSTGAPDAEVVTTIGRAGPCGAALVQRAPWESGIYGLNMARVSWIRHRADRCGDSGHGASLWLEALRVLAAWGVEHVSVLVDAADTALIHVLQKGGGLLVDSTLEIGWDAAARWDLRGDSHVVVREAIDSDRAPLREMCRKAYTTSIRTRFLADPWLPPEATGELYARWFELALDGQFGDCVIVAEQNGTPVGFNTLKWDRDLSEATGIGFANHGIAAVDPTARGLGAQPAMLRAALDWLSARKGRFARGRVLVNNYAMQRACLKSGGFIAAAYHTLHFRIA